MGVKKCIVKPTSTKVDKPKSVNTNTRTETSIRNDKNVTVKKRAKDNGKSTTPSKGKGRTGDGKSAVRGTTDNSPAVVLILWEILPFIGKVVKK